MCHVTVSNLLFTDSNLLLKSPGNWQVTCPAAAVNSYSARLSNQLLTVLVAAGALNLLVLFCGPLWRDGRINAHMAVTEATKVWLTPAWIVYTADKLMSKFISVNNRQRVFCFHCVLECMMIGIQKDVEDADSGVEVAVAVKHTLMFVSVVRVQTAKAKKRADLYKKSSEKRSECAIACAS